MKKLSLTEFQNYCIDKGLKTYVYNTKNQKKKKSKEPINMCVRFNEIFVSLNPDIIFLKNGVNTMSLNSIKCIKVWEEENLPIESFTIVCQEDKEYTFLGYNN